MGQFFNVEAWRQVLVTSLSELGRTLAGFLPSLLGMLVILAVGWGIAKLVEVVARRILDRTGLDGACERLGLSATLQRAAISRGPSQLVGRLLFWLLMLTFVLSAFETLGLSAVTTTIDRVIAYLPRVLGAALTVIFGLLLARFLGSLVSSGAAAAQLAFAPELGSVARAGVVLMVAILASEQLGLDTQVLVTVVTAVVAAIGVGLALAFALGSREIVRAILAGHYVRQSLAEGQPVEIEGRQGVLERVGATQTVFRGADTSWSIPNARLLETMIIHPPSAGR